MCCNSLVYPVVQSTSETRHLTQCRGTDAGGEEEEQEREEEGREEEGREEEGREEGRVLPHKLKHTSR